MHTSKLNNPAHLLANEQLDLLNGTSEAAGSNLRTLSVQHNRTHVSLAVSDNAVGVVDTKALLQVADAQVSLLVSLKKNNDDFVFNVTSPRCDKVICLRSLQRERS